MVAADGGIPSSNPYIGPRAFSRGETLYGRDRELQRLVHLLIAERIVALYSPSGAGKTSLIQAGLIPRLEQEAFGVLPLIRAGLEPPPLDETRASEVRPNRYVQSTILSLEEGQPADRRVPLGELGSLDLPSYLDRRCASTDDSTTSEWVLIFDQFEEILTTDPTDEEAKVVFFAQVGAALRNRRLWALFALREDYLAGLDPYLRPIPTRLHTTFRLDLLGPDAARLAIQQPARAVGVEFENSAAAHLIDDLRRVSVQQLDGSMLDQPGAYVEPVQLQVVCRRLWDRLPAGTTRIVEDHVEDVGDVDHALAGYYAERIESAAASTSVPERTIREWVDRHLITEQGIRGQVLQGRAESEGLANPAILALVDAHLVRAERRRGFTWFELAHDRLIGPVRANNALWFEEHLSELQRQAALWEQQDRPAGLLADGRVLAEGQRWASQHPEQLTAVENEFLSASRAAALTALRQRRANLAIRGLAVLATIAAVVAVFFFRSAELAKTQAVSRELAAAAIAELPADPELSVLIAEQAAHTYTTAEAESALRQSVLEAHPSTTFRGHTAEVLNASYSPDGSRVVTASRDTTGRVWDSTTGEPLFVLDGHTARVNRGVFSPDGALIATASADGKVKVWDAKTGALRLTLMAHPAGVNDAEFSPDSERVVTAGQDGSGAVWDVGSGARVLALTGHSGAITRAAFSPDGSRIVTASQDRTARLWDSSTGSLQAILAGHTQGVNQAEFSPDGQRVVTASADATGMIWAADAAGTIAPSAVLKGHTSAVLEAHFSPDSTHIVTASSDDTARVWDASSGRQMLAPLRSGNVLGGASFSQDGKWIVTTAGDNTTRVWSAKTGIQLVVLRGLGGGGTSAAFSPDGTRVLSSSNDGTARSWIWGATPAASVAVLEGHTDLVHAPAFDATDSLLLTASWDKTARLWDAKTGAPLVELRGHARRLNDAAFSRDGTRVVTASSDGTAREWSSTGQQLAVMQGHSGEVNRAQFSPDGHSIVTAGADGTARIWDAATGALRTTLRGNQGSVSDAEFSPDGSLVATAGFDRTVRVYNATTGEGISTLSGHTEAVLTASFSPDSSRIVSASYDATARIWDVRSGTTLSILPSTSNLSRGATFGPDGTLVVTGSQDSRARIWNATTGELKALLQGHVGPIQNLAVSADGKWVLTASMDQTARIWDIATGRELVVLDGHAGWVEGAAFNADHSAVATTSTDHTARIYSGCALSCSLADLERVVAGVYTRELTAQERQQFLSLTGI